MCVCRKKGQGNVAFLTDGVWRLIHGASLEKMAEISFIVIADGLMPFGDNKSKQYETNHTYDARPHDGRPFSQPSG